MNHVRTFFDLSVKTGMVIGGISGAAMGFRTGAIKVVAESKDIADCVVGAVITVPLTTMRYGGVGCVIGSAFGATWPISLPVVYAYYLKETSKNPPSAN